MPRLAVLSVLSAASSPCPDLNLIHYNKTANPSPARQLKGCLKGCQEPCNLPASHPFTINPLYYAFSQLPRPPDNMKKLLISLLLSLTTLPALAFSTAELAAQLQAPQSVQGGFTQQRFLRSMDKPVQTGGHFALRPGHGLFWHLQKPFDMKLRVRRDGISRQDAQGQWRANGSQTAQAAQVKLFMAVLGGDTAELQRHFDLALSGDARQWQLTLTPKTAVMRQVFNKIVISGGQLVQKVELDEKQGDRTVMQFNQLQTNRPLSPAARQALGE